MTAERKVSGTDSGASSAATSTRSVCCKCGGDDVLKRWHPGKGRYGQGGCGFSAQVVGYTEHLHCTCRTCQFEWMEETLDNLA